MSGDSISFINYTIPLVDASGAGQAVTLYVSICGYNIPDGESNVTLMSVNGGFKSYQMSFQYTDGTSDGLVYFAVTTPHTMSLGDGTAVNANVVLIGFNATTAGGIMFQNNAGTDWVTSTGWGDSISKGAKSALAKKGHKF